jgi:hypothetical protein
MKDIVRVRPLRPYEKVKLRRLKRRVRQSFLALDGKIR